MCLERHSLLEGPSLFLVVMFCDNTLSCFLVVQMLCSPFNPRNNVIILGADGLVKLWTVNTNECIATYDQHEDKVLT